jgi:hypothetical protein
MFDSDNEEHVDEPIPFRLSDQVQAWEPEETARDHYEPGCEGASVALRTYQADAVNRIRTMLVPSSEAIVDARRS